LRHDGLPADPVNMKPAAQAAGPGRRRTGDAVTSGPDPQTGPVTTTGTKSRADSGTSSPSRTPRRQQSNRHQRIVLARSRSRKAWVRARAKGLPSGACLSRSLPALWPAFPGVWSADLRAAGRWMRSAKCSHQVTKYCRPGMRDEDMDHAGAEAPVTDRDTGPSASPTLAGPRSRCSPRRGPQYLLPYARNPRSRRTPSRTWLTRSSRRLRR
jgi:hypothetical protein